jgi:Sec-independent protein translocase protein TatA
MNPLAIFALGAAVGVFGQSLLRSVAKSAVRGALGLQRQAQELAAEAREEEHDARAAAAARRSS